MIQHKRLERMLMSAKVRGKHSIDCNLAEINQLIYEFDEVVKERDRLARENSELKANEKKQVRPASPENNSEPQEPTASKSPSTFNGILDGGSF